MRRLAALIVGLVCLTAALSQDAEKSAKRYDIMADLKTYPQMTPKETLASLLKAAEAKRVDYVLAQLADPDWVDRRVQANGGSFATLVEESTGKLVGDPGATKRLKKLLADGQWETVSAAASVHLKDVEDEGLFFRNIGGRWFIENRKK